MCEPRPENRQRPRFRAAEYINRGGYKQLERDHCGYRIARQAEYRLAAAGPKNGRAAWAGGHRIGKKNGAPLREGPPPQIVLPPWGAAPKEQQDCLPTTVGVATP